MITVPGFNAQTMEFDGAARCVYRAGVGPAVIVMSEIPGIAPAVASFARRVVDAGYTVFMPLLFGEPMRGLDRGYAVRTILKACINREFRVLASLAPVLTQPSLPFAVTKSRRSALHVSPEELRAAHEKIDNHGARILALRFIQDPMCPGERFERLRQEFGSAVETIEIDEAHANPRGPKPAHSVLTNHLIDEVGQPTREALDRTLAFLKAQLGTAASLA
jgi:dienelactone hydrolase